MSPNRQILFLITGVIVIVLIPFTFRRLNRNKIKSLVLRKRETLKNIKIHLRMNLI